MLLALFLSSCTGEPEKPPEAPAAPPPIVLISIDTLRSDRLPIYGYEEVETPAIDALRRDGLLFERAYAHVPLTLPSHVSLLTGLLPTEHGVRDNQGYDFDATAFPYLPSLLNEQGYATGAAVSAFVMRPETGLATGFDFYDGSFEAGEGITFGDVARPGLETLESARGWLEGAAGGPFFFFFHLFEPHTPYEPPEPFASRYDSPYDGEIAAADRVVGELASLLRELGVYDEAVVILLSDHGEGLGDHGEEEHGVFLYREAIQVPLVVKLPGGERAGETVAAPAQLIDVVPTLAQLAGLDMDRDVNRELPGRSLLELGEGDAGRQIYSETYYPRIHYGWSELASLVEGRLHYVEAPRPELYDLVADPAEQKNILREERSSYARLRDAMAAHERGFESPGEVDEETRERLAALGYLGGSTAVTDGPLPDPKEKYPTLRTATRAFEQYRRGDYAAAVELFREALEENPGMADAWEYLADSLLELRRLEEARDAFARAFEATGGDPRLALAGAEVAVRLGELDEARALLEHAAARGEGDAELERRLALAYAGRGRGREAVALLTPRAEAGEVPALETLARVLAELGDVRGAQGVAGRLLAGDPENATAHEALGLAALHGGDFAAAEEHSRRAVAIDPGRGDAWNNLGVALAFLNRPGEALEAWQRALEIDPEAWDVLYNLGLKAAQVGRRDEARRALERFVAEAPPERYAKDQQEARQILARL